MSSRWTNKNAILRDLSLAQGYEVPVDLDSTLAAGDKPPTLNIVEENDDEYFRNYNTKVDDIEGSVAPDIGLIQHMLKMVQLNSSDSDDDSVIVEVSKPPQSAKTKDIKIEVELSKRSPEKASSETEIKTPIKRRRHNVALSSILQGIRENKMIQESNVEPKPDTSKLLKPTDFIPNGSVTYSCSKSNSFLNLTADDSIKETDSIAKVEEWLSYQCVPSNSESNDSIKNECIDKVSNWLTQHHQSSPNSESQKLLNGSLESNISNGSEQSDSKSKNNLLNWEPTAMFRKKDTTIKSIDSNSAKSSPNQKSEAKPTTASYQPSTMADEYYQKFVERSKLNELSKEDVWSRAEKIMKIMDEKRKTELELASGSQHQTDSITTLDEILLPQHRHLLTDDCIVCETVKKNGIEINLELLRDTEFDTKWLPGALEAKHKKI